MHEAKTQLSRLVEEAFQGESFIIARAGKPLVKVSKLDPPPAPDVKRLGFMSGQLLVPDDFDQMGGMDIEVLFTGVL
jgi:antitoxin (DNA-binding transcriptional repressor) of toxin-antitoxin stability system